MGIKWWLKIKHCSYIKVAVQDTFISGVSHWLTVENKEKCLFCVLFKFTGSCAILGYKTSRPL